MKVTGETLLRVGKGELKGLLVNIPGQGWIQSSGQSLSSLVDFFFFFCNHRNKPKAMLLCWMFSVLGAALCVEDCAICCVSGLKVKSYNFL